jgi:hypothetical protein
MSFGRFDGDGRTVVEIGKRRISRSSARRVIEKFNETGVQHSPSGLTASVVSAYCEDLGIKYSTEVGEHCTIIRKLT